MSGGWKTRKRADQDASQRRGRANRNDLPDVPPGPYSSLGLRVEAACIRAERMGVRARLVALLEDVEAHPAGAPQWRRLLSALGLSPSMPSTEASWNRVTERVGEMLRESVS